MRESKERLPKREYFEMRLANAIENGLTKKAEYYKSRLTSMKTPKGTRRCYVERYCP